MDKKNNLVDWLKFKAITEESFKKVEIESCWGFQIQPNTKWNAGLTIAEIAHLENLLGVNFPLDYVEMLKVCNGFETLHISIDPDNKEQSVFARKCYKYPEDMNDTVWLVDEANKYIKSIEKLLEENGFTIKQIEGFIPLYGHRVLVILQDKTLSPVLSIHGADIIIYGKSLVEYWCNEFCIKI